MHHNLPSGDNVCTQINDAIYKVAARTEINPRIVSEAQALFQAPEPNTRWFTQIAGASPPSGKCAFVKSCSARF